MIFDLSNKLGLMFCPLVICSVILLAVTLERIIFFSQMQFNKQTIIKSLNKILRDNKNLSKNIRDEIISVYLSEISIKLNRGLIFLRLVASLSPLIGLLGTVLGIIKAFQKISTHDGVISPSLIAEGLWEAMLTTAVGLAIAIISILVSYIFQSWGNMYINNITTYLNKFSFSIEKQKYNSTNN